ncbi:MAG: ABC transporter ATP-binding protein [Microthrixaceae bacterium]
MASDLLQLEDVVLGYKRSAVIHGVTLGLAEGTRTAMLGANGAGKSTLLKAISGFVRCRSGKITFDGEDISRLRPSQIVDRGIVHVPEGRRVFPTMSVEENLRVGAHLHRAKMAERTEQVLTTFPRLKERFKVAAGLLSGGEQQMLAIGRAMMHGPRVLLLDELSLGLAPITAQAVYASLDDVFEGLTVLLVEQNAKLALSRCEYVYVMRNGVCGGEGPSSEFQDESRLRAVYLGT